MDPITIETAKKVVDAAAAQNDRWLLIALALINILTIYWVAKWFMARNDALQLQITTIQKDFNAFLQTGYLAVSNTVVQNTDTMLKTQNMFEKVVNVLDSTAKVLQQIADQSKTKIN